MEISLFSLFFFGSAAIDCAADGNMSYMKKDEDAEQGMLKLDRTVVFQDGEFPDAAKFE